MTINEVAAGQPDAAEIARRQREGIAPRGRGLIAALYATLRERGGQVHTGVQASKLLTSGDAVVGVEAGGERFPGQVVVASGGFERSPELVRSFLRGPMTAPASPPTNRGDGLRMAMAVGAALGNMSEAWWCPAMAVPGEAFDGAPFFRMLFHERAQPGGLVVDGNGRRFGNEAANYNDFGRALHDFGAANYAYPRVPSWLVCDAARRANFPLGPLAGHEPDPDWLMRGRTLEELAGRIGVPPKALRETVERFNGHAARGVDDDFGRGSYVWDRYSARESDVRRHLRPLSEPPFCAVQVLPGCLGTKGGLKTDGRARVLRADGSGPIPGLYAAGNAAANPFGHAYPGGGATIGPALVFGWLAGETAAAAA